MIYKNKYKVIEKIFYGSYTPKNSCIGPSLWHIYTSYKQYK